MLRVSAEKSLRVYICRDLKCCSSSTDQSLQAGRALAAQNRLAMAYKPKFGEYALLYMPCIECSTARVKAFTEAVAGVQRFHRFRV